MTAFDPRTVRPTDRFPDARRFGAGPFPGQQFPGPVPPPPSRPSRKRPLAAKIVAGLVAAGLVVGGAGTWMAFSGSTAEAAVQSTSFAGANPTTSPFGTDAPQVAAVSATGPQAGDTKGLFAATDPASCDNAAYLRQLQAEPAKLAAVGGVFGLGPADVPAFVNSLSPVVLRANTSVTDHPYSGGAFTEQPAILAAGTAVLVNSYGEPTVKCFNGNPLTAGASAADAVTIVPTTQVIGQFRVTSIDNSRVVVIPGKPDPKPEKGPNPTTTPLTGRYNYDGSVMLSDGRIELPDGSILAPKAMIPPGGVKNPDGSVTVNGTVFNPDGTERKDILVQADGSGADFVPAYVIGVDGVAQRNGVPITPQPKIIRNYDGSATVITGNHIDVRRADGSRASASEVNPPDKINEDGSVTLGDGRIRNPDRTQRKDVTLPDGTVTTPNGGETLAAKQANANGPSLLNKDGSLPAGATKNADGTVTLKDGTVLNRDGTVRTPTTKQLPTGGVDPSAPVQTVPQNCGVIADTGGGSGCKSPTGPVDPASGITPDTGTGSTTGGSTSSGSSSTGTGSGSSSSGSSTSSSSSSSSQGTGNGASDK